MLSAFLPRHRPQEDDARADATSADAIQKEARAELQARFCQFDIECVDVLIASPTPPRWAARSRRWLESCAAQFVDGAGGDVRRSACGGGAAASSRGAGAAQKQTELTASQVQIRIAENAGDADLARARKQAGQAVVMRRPSWKRAAATRSRRWSPARREPTARPRRPRRGGSGSCRRPGRGVGPGPQGRQLRRPAALRGALAPSTCPRAPSRSSCRARLPTGVTAPGTARWPSGQGLFRHAHRLNGRGEVGVQALRGRRER